MGLFTKKSRVLTRENILLLKKGQSMGKVETMFGAPAHKGDPTAAFKKLFGNNMERVITMGGSKKDLLNSEVWGYDVPGGLITLDFANKKLTSWKFNEGCAWNSEAFGSK